MLKVLKITTMQYFSMSQESSDDEVDFLHTDKHQNFLQDNTTFLWFLCIFPGLSKVPRKIYNIFEMFQ